MAEALNPAQRAGVEHRGSPLLLLAGAGTGKTRVITHRVAALIDEGIPPWRILAVTFTNKAAHEMRERIAGLLGLDLDELRRSGPWIGTFHSIAARILRRHGEGVGLTRNFSIYDADDQRSLMRKVLRELDVDPRLFTPSVALGKIDAAKNLGYGRDQLELLGYGEPVLSWTRRAWERYEAGLRAADAADFGDLLQLSVELLRAADPSRRAGDSGKVDPVVGLRRRFLHVVVDEYQDTNPVQAELVDLLCGERTELCVVGDDDQAIYGWRGADVQQILRFPDTHSGCEVIRLEQNYRSTTHILDCANAVIEQGARRHGKQLWSELGSGELVELHGFPSERDEARFVARAVQRAIDDGESPSEIAVFYRTHAQSRPLEEALRLAGVRYRLLGGIRFFDRREIKDLVAYLRLILNPAADLDCLRIINVPARRIGAKTIDRLVTWAVREGTSLYDATGPRSEHGGAAGLGKAAQRHVEGFWQLLEDLRRDGEGLSHDQLAALVLERSAYLDALAEERDGDARIENLQEFVGALEQFVNEQPEAALAEYLEQVALASSDDEGSVDAAITLMTVHSAKGLEFDRVLITGLEERVFPHVRALNEGDPAAIDEERRLAYVALTRARRSLALSWVETRFLWGDTHRNKPSSFLKPLPETSLARRGLAAAQRPRRRVAAVAREPSWDDDIELEPEYASSDSRGQPDGQPSEQLSEDQDQLDLGDEAGVEIYRGMRLRHPKFGVGSLVSWSGSGRNMKLTLRFSAGNKTILARFCEPL